MIKSFSGRVVFSFAIPEPYLLTLAKTDYPSIDKTSENKIHSNKSAAHKNECFSTQRFDRLSK